MANEHNNDSGDDSLASSFVSSFSFPPPSPKVPKEKNAEAGLTDIHLDQPTLIIPAEQNQNEDAPDPIQSSHKGDQSGDPSSVENPVETAKNTAKADEDWKSVLDKNLEVWRGESSVARTKSESTRLRLEEERVRFEKENVQKKKDEEKRKKQEEEDAEVERKLQELLNAPASSSKSIAGQKRRSSQVKQDKERKRWNAVRDAWEIVRDGSSATVPDDEVEADPRDLTAGDAGGLAEPGHRQGAEVLKQAHETITKISQGDGNLDPTPASAQRRNDLLSAETGDASNRRQAVGTSWKDASESIAAEKGATEASAPSQSQGQAGASSSTSTSSKIVSSRSTSTNAVASSSSFSSARKSVDEKTQSDSKNKDDDKVEIGPIPTPSPLSGPPYQPPSLTLSLFTSPSHRSIARIAAVIGINLILPFINGVMLGFGEIFARETVIFGRRLWRGEATLRSLWRPSAGGNLAGLGLGLDSFGETV